MVVEKCIILYKKQLFFYKCMLGNNLNPLLLKRKTEWCFTRQTLSYIKLKCHEMQRLKSHIRIILETRDFVQNCYRVEQGCLWFEATYIVQVGKVNLTL